MLDFRFSWRARKFRSKWDRAEIRALQTLLAPGDCALDVGSHKGGYLYWMRKSVGPLGQVHAIEPQAVLATYLQSIVRKAGWDNVHVHHGALGASDATQTLFVPASMGATSPSASMVASVALDGATPSKAHTEQPTRIWTLDRFVALQGIKKLAFIKIDVEGFEWEVLQGASLSLHALRPVVLLECEDRHLRPQGRTLAAVFELFAKAGYRGTFFDRDVLRDLSEFELAQHQSTVAPRFWDLPGYCNNFLFVPNNAPNQFSPKGSCGFTPEAPNGKQC